MSNEKSFVTCTDFRNFVMRTLLYTAFILFVVATFSCSRNGNDQKDAHKLTDEIVLDSISFEEFSNLMDKAISANDTSDIQKLLGLAQSTYQKIAMRNEAEAENFAHQVNGYLGGQPYLDNLLTNKDNFFFKFNNNDFDEDEDKEENDSIDDKKHRHNDEIDEDEDEDIIVNDPEQTNVSSPEPEKASTEGKKNEEKKNNSNSEVTKPRERVKNSFDNSPVPERKNKERKGTQNSEVPPSSK